MIHPYTRERLSGWVSDHCHGDGLAGLPSALAEHAASLLEAWLVAACERRDIEPEDLELPDLRGALLETVARLELPAGAHASVPSLCKDFLIALEDEGRLSDGRAHGLALAVMDEDYQAAAAGRGRTVKRPGSKLGRNDPCPCGSGKKYKRCCMKT